VASSPAEAALRLEVEPACPPPTPVEVEILGLRREVGFWRAMHRKAVERGERFKQEIEELRAKLSLRERQLFERNSERGSKGKGERSGTKERGSGGKRGQRKGSKGHGRRRHSELPGQEEFSDLHPDDQVCQCCGFPRRTSTTSAAAS